MISIENLNKSYGKKEVLKNVNAVFESGKINGIVGINGAGKTTLFNCICGLTDFDGKINYENKIIKNISAYLPTNPYFISKITGKEYLQLMCNARNIKLPDLKEKNIFDLPLQDYATNYSTGMKKKLALTAILLQKNQIYIFDEPFNGLDLKSNLMVSEIILKLKSLQKVVILSSHIFESLKNVCDQIFYLKEGNFNQTFDKNNFDAMEAEMKSIEITSKIDLLDLM